MVCRCILWWLVTKIWIFHGDTLNGNLFHSDSVDVVVVAVAVVVVVVVAVKERKRANEESLMNE